MTPKRKPLSALARLTASHMRLLKLLRGQIQELGELRKVILDMQPPKEFEVPPPIKPAKAADYKHDPMLYWIGKDGEIYTRVEPPNDWPRL